MNTANEVLKQVLIEYLEAGKDTSKNRAEAVDEAMIRFAKMHVEAALKAGYSYPLSSIK